MGTVHSPSHKRTGGPKSAGAQRLLTDFSVQVPSAM